MVHAYVLRRGIIPKIENKPRLTLKDSIRNAHLDTLRGNPKDLICIRHLCCALRVEASNRFRLGVTFIGHKEFETFERIDAINGPA